MRLKYYNYDFPPGDEYKNPAYVAPEEFYIDLYGAIRKKEHPLRKGFQKRYDSEGRVVEYVKHSLYSEINKFIVNLWNLPSEEFYDEYSLTLFSYGDEWPYTNGKRMKDKVIEGKDISDLVEDYWIFHIEATIYDPEEYCYLGEIFYFFDDEFDELDERKSYNDGELIIFHYSCIGEHEQ